MITETLAVHFERQGADHSPAELTNDEFPVGALGLSCAAVLLSSPHTKNLSI